MGSRKIVQESNKVVEVEILNVNTSFVSTHVTNAESFYNEGNLAGKVDCAVPFASLPALNADFSGL